MSRSNQKRNCTAGDANNGIVPAGTPDWITADLIELTIRVWQPHYSAALTAEAAVAMIIGVGQLCHVLAPRRNSP